MTLEELADVTQDAADVAWATWQRITKIADLLRGAADAQQADKNPEQKDAVERANYKSTITANFIWNPIRDALEKPE